MNAVFLFLLVTALVVAAVQGTIEKLTAGALDGASAAVTLAIGLVGVLALWMGLLRVAEEAGFVRLLARAVRPVMRRLFPDVPADHPAMGAMILNVSANMLGLGNAATPLGIKAMEELQSLNPQPRVATDAMVLFLAINTSSVQLVPATVVALRAAAGAPEPADVVGPTLLATLCSTIVGVTAAKLLARTRLARRDPP